KGAATTLDALAYGAKDYITKPATSGGAEEAVEHFQQHLLPRIKALAGCQSVVRISAASMDRIPGVRETAAPSGSWQPEVVGMAVSTGGPNALAEMFQEFPANYPLPILIVQHMPPMFTRLLAERLDSKAGIR